MSNIIVSPTIDNFMKAADGEEAREEIGANNASNLTEGELPSERLPDEIDARIQVLGGTSAYLEAASLGENEIAADTSINSLVFGDSNGLPVVTGISPYSAVTLQASPAPTVSLFDLASTPNSWSTSFGVSSILAFYGGARLKTLGRECFESCSNLTRVSIPFVELIGRGAFADATSLQTITGSRVVTIEQSAFADATLLASAYFRSAQTLGDSAFQGCESLALLSIPSVVSMGDEVFDSCSLQDLFLNAPFSGLDSEALSGSNINTIHLRPAPFTPAGWTLGAGQTIKGKTGITVVADWVNWPATPSV